MSLDRGETLLGPEEKVAVVWEPSTLPGDLLSLATLALEFSENNNSPPFGRWLRGSRKLPCREIRVNVMCLITLDI